MRFFSFKKLFGRSPAPKRKLKAIRHTGCRPLYLERLEPRWLPSIFNVTNTNDSGAGSLRQAILDANSNPGADTIEFSIGTGAQTISVTSALPSITDAVTIDATTQPGWVSAPIIQLDGTNAGAGANGFVITAANSTVRGFVINRFSANGIVLTGGATDDVIQGNYIGTDVTGTTALGNAGTGIALFNIATNNTIGGIAAGTGNLISGNLGNGVSIDGFGGPASGNVVEGNLIGTDVTGLVALGNGSIGVVISLSASNNLIGGTVAGAGNVISGNGGYGIRIVDNNTTGNVVQGNLIGTNRTGTAALGNANDGIRVEGGTNTSNNVIGGNVPTARNIISGNLGGGIGLDGAGAFGTLIQGNYIGTDETGTLALGNGTDGIDIIGAGDNTIGGTTPAAANVLSGNGFQGIFLSGAGTSGNVIEGNFIGTDYTGTKALGNHASGIFVDTGSTGNVIGGTAAGAGNVISANIAYDGVFITGATTTGNVVEGNYIGTDVTGTIALGNTNNGVFISNAPGNTIGGTVAGARNILSGNGGNGVLIDGSTATGNVVEGNYIGTNAAGTANVISVANSGFEVPNQGSGPLAYTYNPTGGSWTFVGGTGITANFSNWGVTDAANGNSDGTTSTAGQTAFIQGGNGTTSGSAFSQALTGFVAGYTSVSFSIQGRAGFGNNPIKVMLDSQDLGTYSPQSTGSFNTVITPTVAVTAGSHTLYFIGTNGVGDNDSFVDNIRVINTIGNSSFGISISSPGNTVGGTAAGAGNVISGNLSHGIDLTGASATGNLVAGNLIGTDATGTARVGNGGLGVQIDTGAANNTIGGTTAAARNIISGNGQTQGFVGGLYIIGSGSSGNVVAGNYIGTDITGTASLGNAWTAVGIFGAAANNTIGGTTAGAGNVISGNTSWGVEIHDAGSTSNLIAGNFIGTDKTGTAPLGNSSGGVLIWNGATGNTVGGTTAAARNIISANATQGVVLANAGTNNNLVEGNYIGTDVNGNGLLPNLVTWWRAEGNVLDSVDSNNGSLQGGATFATGRAGQAFSLNGTSAYVQFNSHVVPTSGSYSVSLFARQNATQNGYIELISQGSSGGPGFYIGHDPNNIIRVSDSWLNTGVAFPTDTLWHLFTVTVDSSANQSKLYLDGTLRATLNQAITTTTGGTNTRLGRQFDPFGEYFNGLIDEVAIYSRALSASDVLALFNAGNVGKATIIGNRFQGVVINSGASGNTIGGNVTGAGNVISGNSALGVDIDDNATSNNVVAGNFIGTNAAGTQALGNLGFGVQVYAAVGTRIGSDGDGVGDDLERNVISGNTSRGISAAPTQVTSLSIADQLISAALPRTAFTGTVAQADFSDAVSPANGNWSYNNPIPGGGGQDYVVGSTGTINVTTAGAFTFAISNDDGGRLRIDGANVVVDDSLHAFRDNFGTVTLSAGTHSFEWTGFQRGGAAGFELSVKVGSGQTGPVTTANGWHVLGDPSPDPAIALQGTISTTVYYSTGINQATIAGNYIGTNAAGTAALRNGGEGIFLDRTANNTIGGVTAATRNVIGGNNLSGVTLSGNVTTGNLVEGNYIGLDKDGINGVPNSQHGVLLVTGAHGNTIGGRTSTAGTGAGNVISGNTLRGIQLNGATVAGNVVQGNLIGTNAAGNTARANQFGVIFFNGAHNNIIGTDGDGVGDAQEGNVISGNSPSGDGVNLNNGNNNLIAGNYIGTDITGTFAIPNGDTGVALYNGSAGNTIGGTTPAMRNLISGNTHQGVWIGAAFAGAPGPQQNIIAGNWIGLNAAGNALANGINGIILFDGAHNNIIGLAVAGGGNVISGQTGGAGIRITKDDPTDGVTGATAAYANVVQNNFIGTNVAGAAAIANSTGVLIELGSHDNTIGGTTATARNIISGNSNNGVQITGSGSSNNLVAGNYIGTDVTGTALLSNVLSGIQIDTSAANNTIGGLTATPGTGLGNVISGNNQWGVNLGANNTLIEGNIVGLNAAGTAALRNMYEGFLIAGVTGTTVGGTAAGARNIISGNTGGYGQIEISFGSTNTLVQGNYIGPDITGTQGGLGTSYGNGFTIVGASNNTIGGTTAAAANVISGNATGLLIINATNFYGYTGTATGNVVQGNLIGTDKTGTVALANSQYGISISANSNTIGGTVSGAGNVISGNTLGGVLVSAIGLTGNLFDGTGNVGATANVLQGNYIGTNAVGTSALANGGDGIHLQAGTTNNTIGGTVVAARNIISGNSGNGVTITDSGTSSNVVEGNYIGTDAAGTAALGNGASGVKIDAGAASNTIGGFTSTPGTGAGNVISGNAPAGVFLAAAGANNVIEGNIIGPDATGTLTLGNQVNGITVNQGQGTLIGGANSQARNIISGNTLIGINLSTSGSNFATVIQGNYIGTDITGSQALGNDSIGVSIGNSPGTTLGGTAAGAGNVISGNATFGVSIDGPNSGSVVAGNFIGLNAAGTAALGNKSDGIYIYADAPGNTIGGTAAGAGNVIAGNLGNGITINSSGNLVEGNYIGTDAAGMAALGNAGDGVHVQNGAANNTIGGTATGVQEVFSSGGLLSIPVQFALDASGNILAADAGVPGVVRVNPVTGAQSIVSSGGSFVYPTGLAIGADGTIFVADRNAVGGPAIIEVDPVTGAQTILSHGGDFVTPATITLTPAGQLLVVDHDAFGGGGAIIRVDPVTGVQTVISSGGSFQQPVFVAIESDGQLLVTDAFQGAIYRVDPSTGSQTTVVSGSYLIGVHDIAIEPDGDLLVSNASTNSIFRINPTSGDHTTVSSGGSLDYPTSFLLMPNGDLLVSDAGLNHTAGPNFMRIPANAARNIISGNSGNGVTISDSGTTGNVVEGNYIGTDVTGTAALGNALSGVQVDSQATGNTIDGAAAGAGNVISANGLPAGIVSWYRADGNAFDSVSGNNGTLVGGVSFDAGKSGPAFGFHDSSAEKIAVPDAPSLSLTTVTLEAWIKLNSLPTTAADYAVVTKGISGNSENYGLYIDTGRTPGNVPELDFEFYDGGFVNLLSSGAALTTGAFHHVAVTADGTTVKFYVDGNFVSQTTQTQPLLPNNLSLQIGSARPAFSNDFDGLIDDLAIYNRALSNSEISAIFNAGGGQKLASGNASGIEMDSNAAGNLIQGNFIGTNATGTSALGNSQYGVYLNTASVNSILNNTISGNASDGVNVNGNGAPAATVSWWPLDETTGSTAKDIVGTNDGTLTGTTSVSGEVGNGRRFDANDVFTADGNGTLNLTSNKISIEAWIKLENNPTSSQTFTAFVGKTTFPNNQAYLMVFESGSNIGSPQNEWRFEYVLTNSDGTRVHNQSTNVDVTVDGLYHHFAMTYDGANVRLYVDGALRGTFAFTGNLEAVPSDPFRILGSAPFSIDEPTIYNRALSAAEIQAIYNLRGASKGGATIQGNVIGTNAAGTAALSNGGNGVTITNAAGNTIGGTMIGDRNIISGNPGNGVSLFGASNFSNVVEGNYIGTDVTGTIPIGNLNGIDVGSGAHNNRIGTDGNGVADDAERNIISGNTRDAISIFGEGTNNNIVAGNYIGVDVSGLVALSNQNIGVNIGDGAQHNLIGTSGQDVDNAGERNVISACIVFSGIAIHDANTNFNVVAGNYIGTDATGTMALGNALSGIDIDGGASFNIVGTNGDGVGDSDERNVISGNGQHGVYIFSSGTNHNVVAGNYIGTNATGTAALGNLNGVDLNGGAQGNRVGTDGNGISDDLERNIISGNTRDGLTIFDLGTSNNIVAGNYIGPDVSGLLALGNQNVGINIGNGAQYNRVGTDGQSADNTSERNVISASHVFAGVAIHDTNTNFNVVAGNYIGTDVTGAGSLGNAGGGIAIHGGASFNIIGTNGDGIGDAAERNVISGNLTSGIFITDSATTQNVVAGNYIGSTAGGVGPLGNGNDGIRIDAGAYNNTIGGSAAGASNTIAFNNGAGVTITGTSTGNAIRVNTIHDNAGLGIDLGNDGPTPNDSQGHIGPNNFTNFPVLSTVIAGPTNTTLQGTLHSTPNTTYFLDIYANNTADPSGYGEGEIYLGSVQVGTDATGLANFNLLLLAATSPGQFITMTATDAINGTSEFAQNFTAPFVNLPVVTINGPAGSGAAAPVTFTSTVTDANPGVTLFYQWSVTQSGNPSFTLPADVVTDQPAFTFTPPTVGTYQVQLLVIDSLGGAGLATADLSVTPTGPAVLITGVPTNAAAGTAVSLGSSVTDPVGAAITSYLWSVLRDNQPFDPGTTTTGPTFSFTPTVGGVYTVSLVVTDATGASGTGQASFFVSDGIPSATILAPATGQEGVNVSVSSVVGDPSLAGPLTYAWSVTKNGVAFDSLTSESNVFIFTPDDEGTYHVSLVISDGQGDSATASPVDIAVDDTPPTATITSGPTAASVGTPITFTGAGSTPSTVDTDTLSWTVLSGGAGKIIAVGSGPAFSYTPSAAGLDLVTLTDTDEQGNIGTTSVLVGISLPGNSVTLTQDGAVLEGTPSSFTAAVNNPNPAATYTFAWTVQGESNQFFTSSPGTPLGSSQSSFTFAPPAVGTYLVGVSVSGSDGSAAAATLLVTAANVAPTVSITGNPAGTVFEGAEITLAAQASDPGGISDFFNYTWAITGPDGFNQTGNGPTITFVPQEFGTYSETVAVTDSSGGVGVDTKSITITHVRPIPNVRVDAAGTIIQPPITKNKPGILTLSLIADVPDPGPDNDQFNYTWTAIDLDIPGSSTVQSGSSPDFVFSGLVEDSFQVTLQVTDEDGGNETVTIPIEVANAGQTMTLSGMGTASEVLAVASGNAKIDAHLLTVPFVAAAVGGNDTLIGGSGSNVLQGDSGFNSLVGGSGPNTLFGTANDTLVGGTGTNTNMFALTPGVNEVVIGGSQGNTLSFAQATAGITLDLTQNTGQVQNLNDGNGSTLALTGLFQNVVGSAGNDVLFAASNSTVYSGGGNDMLVANNAANVALVAGTSADLAAALGIEGITNTTQFGASGGNSTLSSSGGSNIILVSGSGNSTLSATGGTSILEFGGTGNASLSSSGGSSITLFGGSGNSTLTASGGTSITLFGGSGNSTLMASGGTSITLFGGTGNDLLSVTAGIGASLFGGSGNSTLMASGGSSITLFGGSGNSTLSASGGSSITLFAGSGNDLLSVTDGTGVLVIGGEGDVTLTSTGGSNITLFGGSGSSTLMASGGSNISLFGGSGNSTLMASGGTSITLFGGSGNDLLSTTDGSNATLFGGSGNSTLMASGGTSITLFGGTGNDSISATNANDVLAIGGDGNSALSITNGTSATLFGGSGSSTLMSSGGSSISLFGGSGNSTLMASGGTSITLFGGSGNDLLSITGGTDATVIGGTGNSTLSSSGDAHITLFGGDGSDALSSTNDTDVLMIGGAAGGSLSIINGTDATLFGGSGSSTLMSSGGSSISLFGGSGNSTLMASGGTSITLFGGSGNDSLSTANGTDVIVVGGGGNSTLASSCGTSITLFGGMGNSTLMSSGGSSISLFGGSGNSTLMASGGTSITLFGGAGNDLLSTTNGRNVTVFGGTGNSTLMSSGGTSITLFGGTGSDSISTTGGSSVSVIAGSGNSTITASGGTSLTLFGGSGNDSISTTSGMNVVATGGTGNSTLAASGGTSITLFGGSGNDSISTTGGSSVSVIGGDGNSTITASGGTSLTLFGGSGNDSISTTGGTNVTVVGGTGNATLSSSGGMNITLFGGSGNDAIASSNDTNVSATGGSGSDTITSAFDSNASMSAGGVKSAQLSETGGTSVSLFGGAGDDTLTAVGGQSISLFGEDGNNTFQLTGTAGSPLSVSVNDLDTSGPMMAQIEDTPAGINTLLFPGVNGITLDLSNFSTGQAVTPSQVQQVGSGLTVALTGLFQNVVGTPGDDNIKGNSSANVLDGGSGGNDTLTGGSGPATLVASPGNDLLVAGTGGTAFDLSHAGSVTIDPPAGAEGRNALDFSSVSGPVTINLGLATPQSVGGGLTITLQDPAGINAVIDSPFGDNITGNSTDDYFFLSGGNDTVTGGGGNDTYFFLGNDLGAKVITETANTNNTLNFLGFDGPINLDLTQSGQQTLNPGRLSLTLTNPSAFTGVVGTAYNDTIKANSGNDTLIGGGGQDSLIGGSGADNLQGYLTQVVYLTFPDTTMPGAHVYTDAEKAAILVGLARDYAAFDYFFTTDLATAHQMAKPTGGRFATLVFNQGPAGGASSQLDPDNQDLGGVATINIGPFLGDASLGLVPPSSSNIVNLATTIAAHELGHASGLQHQDAIGPIGTGIFAGVDPNAFNPAFPGPFNAVETQQDIMASPASVGTTLLDAAGQTYFGERDAIKLAFNDTGTLLRQGDLATTMVSLANLPDITSAYIIGNLPGLTVPNTLGPSARDFGTTFNVSAVAINAALATPKQEDFYSINGTAGEVLTFQVISNNNTLNAHPIIPELEVVDPSNQGTIIAYNEKEFESFDSTLFDVVLPHDGTYYVGVDSYTKTMTGSYQLFMYSFATGAAQISGDTLVGRGNATLMGSSGSDRFTFLAGATGSAVVQGGSGQTVLDLTQATGLSVAPSGNLTLLQSSAATALLGASVTLTATVTAYNGLPTGTVDFQDTTTGTDLGTAGLQVVNGVAQASISTDTLAIGTHIIKAVYAGTNTFTSSEGLLTQVITPAVASTTTALSSSVNPSVYGQSVAFAASVTASFGTATGSVTFYDGATLLGTGTLQVVNGMDQAAFSTASLSVAAHSITASYAGTSGFTASTSDPLSQVVNPAATTTAINSSVNPSVYGQTVVFTASVSVTAPGAGTPTGTVTFYDGATSIGTGTLAVVNGVDQATFSTSSLSVATHSITATYSTDGNFAGSTSGALSQVVNPAATTTAISSSVNPSVYGQTVVFTASVSVTAPGAGTPTGTVTFYDSATSIGTGTLAVVNGVDQATFSTSSLSVATHSITATYSTDGNFAGSTSGALSQVVNPAATTTAISSSVNPSVYGQTVIFTATVSATSPGAGTPGGIVTFKDGAATLGTGTLSVVNGVDQATFSTSSLSVTTHIITAVYGGDTNFTTSTSGTLSQIVNKAATSTALSSSANPSVYGQVVTFTATVAASSPGAGTPTGTVTFYDGATSIGTGTLAVVNGVDQATFTTSSLIAATHTITASYGGDTNFTTSTSSAVSQQVNQAVTATAGSFTGTQYFGQALTFTATVSANAPSTATPNGSVDFLDITTNNDLGTVRLAGGKAALSITSLPTGTQTITMSYLGNGNFLASSSSVTVTIVSSVWVLDATASGALTIANSAVINIPGLVMVDSSSSTALQASGSAKITAGSIQVVGGVKVTGSAVLTPAPKTGVALASDPLANLPDVTGGTSQGSVSLSSGAKTINPGIYTSISVSGSAKLTLNPGVYILAGGNFTISNSASVTGSGVMIYMAGSNYPNAGGTFGSITVSNSANVNLTAAATGTYAGIAIFQARTDANTISFKNSAVVNLNGGLIYSVKALLSIESQVQLQHAPMVVDQFKATSSSSDTAPTSTAPAPTNSLGTPALSYLLGSLTPPQPALSISTAPAPAGSAQGSTALPAITATSPALDSPATPPTASPSPQALGWQDTLLEAAFPDDPFMGAPRPMK